MLSRLLAVCIVVTFGCGRDHAPTASAAPPKIELACDDEIRSIDASDLALDDALCGEPWTAWEIDAPNKIELVHAQAGRTLRLRRRGAEAVVEVLEGDRVASMYAGVTRIAVHEPTPPEKAPSITVTKGAAVEQLSMSELAKRYPGSHTKAVPLCVLFDPTGAPQTLVVVGENGTSSGAIDRAACERDGLILHASNRGDIQLRDRKRQRIVSGVTGVVVARPDILVK